MSTSTTILSKAVSRVRAGRGPALIVAGGLLLWWCYLILGPNLPALLIGIALVLGVAWVVRRHRPIAICAAITTLTASVLGVACVVAVNRQTADSADTAAVITGYLLVTPIPALMAGLQRPALVSAPLSTLIGSAILLLSTAPVMMIGAYELAAAVLVTTASAAAAVPYLRHRRAAAALTGPLPTLHGWTDLGARRTPDGGRVDRLLLGGGAGIVCCDAGHRRVTDRTALAAARRAIRTADAIGLPTRRVQAVIVSPGNKCVRNHLVNDGTMTASVVIIGPDQLDQVIAQVDRRRQRRRPLLAAALLPTPQGQVP